MKKIDVAIKPTETNVTTMDRQLRSIDDRLQKAEAGPIVVSITTSKDVEIY